MSELPPDLQSDRFGFLHIDLNSFFASVEQQLHPEFRDRPLAVVPTRADTTCCIAASYEAKALGIKTGTQVGEAKKKCPEIILVAGDHADYRCWIGEKCVQRLQLRIAATQRLLEVKQTRRAGLERSKELRWCGQDKPGTRPALRIPVSYREKQFRLESIRGIKIRGRDVG